MQIDSPHNRPLSQEKDLEKSCLFLTVSEQTTPSHQKRKASAPLFCVLTASH